MSQQHSSRRDPGGYYAMLGVQPDASFDEIYKAYQSVLDTAHKNGVFFAAQMAKHAFATLGNEEARSSYDVDYKSPLLKKSLQIQPSKSHYEYRSIGGSVGDHGPLIPPPKKSWWENLLG